ncbi:hypothetical protein LTR92_009904 [Exophiala xenobiotica]|nr:hypothetical protein LTR92_009904 [Exophiala xenobiotica]KAK5440335.1 hypothetical protein LTR18_007623 [Exophiala xenobiotica]KAK5552213.1 hypothetical protein LTR46_009813 [Exophiala xenobiotica]
MPDLNAADAFPNDDLVKETSHNVVPNSQNEAESVSAISSSSRPREDDQNNVFAPDLWGSSGPNVTARDSNRRRQSSGLIRDDSGHAHFIGPSGTLSFFADLRQLVLSREKNSGHAIVEPRSHFAHDDTAKALEADENDIHESNQQDSTELLAGPSPQSILSELSKEFSGPTRPDPAEYLKSLPPQEAIDELCNRYFTEIHRDFPLFHRATFEDELEANVVQWRSRAPLGARKAYERKATAYGPDFGWLACLHMILLLGSVGLSRTGLHLDLSQLRRNCLSEVRSLLPHLVTKCTVTSVQALLLQSLFLHNNNHRNGAWTLLGTATRISFALGLHRQDLDTSFRPVERELRKRVFCTLYGFEQFLSSSLGRPSGLNEFDVEVKAPRDGFLDDSAGASSQFTVASLQLQKVLGQTRSAIAKLKDKLNSNPPSNISSSVPGSPDEEILGYLETWKQSLPSHLQMASIGNLDDIPLPRSATQESADNLSLSDLRASLSRQTPSQLRGLVMLHVQYHYIALLVTRPTLLWEISSFNSCNVSRRASYQADNDADHGGSFPTPGIPSSMGAACHYHAAQLVALIVLLDKFQLVNGVSALDVFYAYSAGLVLILGLLKSPHMSRHEKSSDASSRRSLTGYSGRCINPRNTHALIRILRSTIGSVQKCATMKRMAGVMHKFADSVIKDGEPSDAGHQPEPIVARTSSLKKSDARTSAVRPRRHHHRHSQAAETARSQQAADGERAPAHSGLEGDTTSNEPFWPSPDQQTNAENGLDGMVPTADAAMYVPFRPQNFGQHSQMDSAEDGNIYIPGQESAANMENLTQHGISSTLSYPAFQYPYDVSRASIALDPFSNSSGMQADGSFFPAMQGQSQNVDYLQRSSFWHDPFGTLADGQILDWADLETFLAT